MAGKLFLISAPSGAGKTSLIHELINRYGVYYNLERVVTYTSKKPRPNEIHRRDYNFLTSAEFEIKIQEGFFLEWSGAYEAYYGSPRSILEELGHGKSFLLIIDRVGAAQILKEFSAAVPIWIYTHSLVNLRERLIHRNTEGTDHIDRRINRALLEISDEIASPIYRYHVLNYKFEVAVEKLFAIIKRELL